MQRNATDQNRTRQIFFLSFDGNEKILTQFRSLFAPPMHALSSCRYKFCFWVANFFSSSFTGFQVFRSITFRVLDDSRRVDRSSTLSNISSVSCNNSLSLSLSLSLSRFRTQFKTCGAQIGNSFGLSFRLFFVLIRTLFRSWSPGLHKVLGLWDGTVRWCHFSAVQLSFGGRSLSLWRCF